MKKSQQNLTDTDRYLKNMNAVQELMLYLGLERAEWEELAECAKEENKDIDFFPLSEQAYSAIAKQRRQYPNATQRTIRIQQAKSKEAIEVCQKCPVLEQCKRDHTHEQDGIWYGTVPAERIISYKDAQQCDCSGCRARRRRMRAANDRRRDLKIDDRRREQGTGRFERET